MSKILFSESLRQWEEGFTLAKQANEWLPEVLGQTTLDVEGEWGRDKDEHGDPIVTLRLRDRDSIGEVIGKLGPDDLRSPNRTSFRMYRLMGNLLRVHMDVLYRDLQSMEY